MIELQQITHRYRPDGPDVIDDLTLHVAAGEFVALVGESGCGKTTTLKTINRLVRPSQGAVTVDGRDVSKVRATKLRRGIGYVFQQIGLLPHLTVADNIAVVPRLLRWKPAAVEARVQELLGLVNLPAEAASQMPDQLSGGQQQRVGVARALAARPRAMLMDEPFGALDPINRAALQHEVARLHRELELTTVLVTHDMAEALLLADRVAVMREGRLLQVGTPRDLLTHPADDYVASVVGTPRRQADRIEALAGDVANRGELLGVEPLYDEGDQP